MRRYAFAALSLALAPFLMAQTAPPATISDFVSPVLAPVAAQFSAEPQTATGTAVLLSQQALVVGAVRTDAPVAGAIPVGNVSLTLALPAGAELFPVALQNRRGVQLFCTPATTATVTNPLRPPMITRSCLANTNGDRIADNLGFMQVNVTASRAVSGAWQMGPAPHVGGGEVTIATAPIASPVPLTPAPQTSIAPVVVEITARIVGDVANIEVRSREGDVSAPLSELRTTVAKATMPRTVTLYGAQIELQSLENGTLTYRVVNGFATDQPLVFPRAGSQR
jgi:hypothetical protein